MITIMVKTKRIIAKVILKVMEIKLQQMIIKITKGKIKNRNSTIFNQD